MTERCLELLLLPEDTPCLLLDIGCGSGLSGSVLEEDGHMWIGLDISSDMLGKLILTLILILYKKIKKSIDFRSVQLALINQ